MNRLFREILTGIRSRKGMKAMQKEVLRDKTLDWFEALAESALMKRITWFVIIFAALYFPAVYLVRHF